MILFDVKNDGTVKTVPMEMAQGSTLADLVVIAEAEYALVTMRLVPPSGLYIPDIIFARIKVDGAIMWKADLPADASITEGSIKYQIFLTDATGEVLETPEGRMTIPKGVLSDMPETVEHLKQYTINELYTLLSGIHTEMTAVDTRLDNIDTRLRLSRLTIPVTEWTDGMPYQATAWLQGMEFGQSEYTKAYTALLIPLNKETRLEAQKTELRVNETIAFPGGSIEIILLREDHVPSVPLDFAVATLMLDNPDTTVFKASASFVGVTELPDELMEREVMRVAEPHFEEMQENLDELTASVTQLGKRTIISMITIEPSAWSDSDPYVAFNSVFAGIDNPYSSATILLIPRDQQTRAEARKMELSVDYAYPSSVLLTFWMTRTEYAPTVPLNFAALTVLSDKSPGDTGYSIAASFVGVTELPDELMDKEVLRVLKANKYANEERVTELINESLGVIENGSY